MVQECVKYLVCEKEFTVEHDIRKKKKNLENARKAVAELKGECFFWAFI